MIDVKKMEFDLGCFGRAYASGNIRCVRYVESKIKKVDLERYSKCAIEWACVGEKIGLVRFVLRRHDHSAISFQILKEKEWWRKFLSPNLFYWTYVINHCGPQFVGAFVVADLKLAQYLHKKFNFGCTSDDEIVSLEARVFRWYSTLNLVSPTVRLISYCRYKTAKDILCVSRWYNLRFGHRCLESTCRNGRLELVKYRTNEFTQSCLKRACISGNIALVRYILANSDLRLDESCLWGSCWFGNVKMVLWILKHSDLQFSQECLRNACFSGKLRLIKFIESKM